MVRSSSLALFLFCGALAVSVAFGQSTTGLPPMGSFAGGPVDTINLANLNVHFGVPIVQKAGRGIPFTYTLSYDSSVWTQVSVNGNPVWQPVSNWGWRGVTEAAIGYISKAQLQIKCFDDPAGPYYAPRYSNYAYHDAAGTVHYFTLSIPLCNTASGTGTATATDGSGYVISVDEWAGTETVQDTSGTTINPGPGVLTDRNGNQLSTNGTSFTDTLGTTALTISGTAPSPVSYTYTGPTGGGVSATVSYVSHTVQTNFGCTGVTDYGPTSVSLADTITMPDGTTYKVAYEQTPGHAGNVTGRIASLTLPTGGQITYAYTGGNNGINCADGSPAGMTRTTLDGTNTYTHSVSGSAGTTTVNDAKGNQTVLQFQQIYETERQVYQGTSSVLETVLTCYNGSASPCNGTQINLPITQRSALTQLPDSSGKTSRVDTFFNSNGLVTETDEYDFGAGTPTRKTTIAYAALGNNILGQPSQVSTYDGVGTLRAQTTYSYTNAVTATSGTPQHAGISGDRGNVASITKLVQGSSTVTRSFTYFDTGLVQTATDWGGHTTSYAYGACGNSFVTSVTLPQSLSRSAGWNCAGAVQTSATDENNQTTTYTYGDSNYWRVTSASYPDGGQATNTYNLTTAPWNIVQSKKLNASQSVTTKTVFDALGRAQQTQLTSDPEGTTYVDTTYDGIGLVHSTSNPYRSTSDPTYGVITVTTDALGRTTATTQPDGNAVSASYVQNCTTTTDESGKQRQACVDGLGRVTSVLEPNDTTGALTWETDYQYDTLDDLTRVDQKGGTTDSTQWRTRTFGYDGLGRMTQSVTPEAGTTTVYFTTSGGGLCSGNPSAPCRQTDARGITTTFSYDGLNRLLSKSHSDGSPTVGYEYDQSSLWGVTLANPKGRPTHQYTGANAERIFSYDAMGRAVSQWDALPSNFGSGSYQTSIAYDLAGNITQLTYPSSRKVSYTYSAAGRPTAITLTGGNGQSLNYPYVSGVNYAPSGAPSSTALANGLTEALTYNNRLELATSKISSSILTAANHSYSFADTSGKNNGTLLKLTDSLNAARTQTFTYDALNRLSTATETLWGLSYKYDAWGNLLQQNVTAGSAPTLNVLVNGSNQLTGSGFGYDAAGNLVADGSHSYQYDAESRMKSLDTTGATYLYDVNSQRIRKQAGSAVTENIVLGTQLLAERNGSGDWSDFVYLNGRMVVKADSFEDRILTQGTNSCSGCGEYSLFEFPSAGGYAGYVIRSGDKLFLRQWQTSGAHGGMDIVFSDGTNTNWSAQDQDGYTLNNDGTQTSWHYRRADLSSFAGKTISHIYLVSENTTSAGAWSIYFNDVSLVSTDGTVRPLYNRETSVSLSASGSSGVTGRTYSVSHVSNEVQVPDLTTVYFHPDHLGSGRLISGVNGYPIWQATYLPYGYEYNQQLGINSFKFAGYERDAESNLDYASFRYFSNQWTRFMRPDPLGGNLAVPQTLNRYAYVASSPLNATDPLGLDLCLAGGYCDTGYTPASSGTSYAGEPDMPTVYTVDGAPVSGSFAASLLHTYTGAVCPNNNCSQIQQGPDGQWQMQTYQPGSTAQDANGNVYQVIGGWRNISSAALNSTNSSIAPSAFSPPDDFASQRDPGRKLGAISTIVDTYSRITHPLEIAAANASMFVAAGGSFVVGGLAITGGCLDPSPAEPVTCAAGIFAGTHAFAGGVVSGTAGVIFFEKYTIPAFQNWGKD